MRARVVWWMRAVELMELRDISEEEVEEGKAYEMREVRCRREVEGRRSILLRRITSALAICLQGEGVSRGEQKVEWVEPLGLVELAVGAYFTDLLGRRGRRSEGTNKSRRRPAPFRFLPHRPQLPQHLKRYLQHFLSR